MHKTVPVLFLVIEFPPVNTTGNYRSLKFVKYLRQFGIEPIVVTLPEDEAAGFFNAPIDQSLMQDIPEGTSIYRIHCEPLTSYRLNKLGNFLSIYFSLEDGFRRKWMPALKQNLHSIIEKHKPVAVYTSLPPFSAGKLAVNISRQYKLPLVVDMRDLWAFFGATPLNSWFHFRATLNRESEIFNHAAAVLGVTPQMLDIIKKAHPDLPQKKLHLLYNGFDFDIRSIAPIQFAAQKQTITIGYIGAFYFYPEQRDRSLKPWWKKPLRRMLEYAPQKQDWLYRSPYFLFRAINTLFAKYPEYKKRVRIEFIGKIPGWLQGMVETAQLQDNVVFHGFLRKEQAMTVAATFDLLLATSEKVENDEHYSLASKVFDYIELKKPTLAFVTPGIQRVFFEQSGMGLICDPDQPEQAAEQLRNLFEQGHLFSPVYSYLDGFHRKHITAQLAGIFKQVTGVPEPAEEQLPKN